jgi:3-methyl-2-oxobutanoate hydroxymethyltransferase
MTVPAFRARKNDGPPLVVLTAYDVPTATAAEAGGVDAILVGDSLGNVLLGLDTTLRVTLDDMVHHGRAAARARTSALLILDMPWMTYHVTTEDAVRNAARLVRETSADAVKVEGGAKRVPAIRAILDAEIPVMGHLGLTPQSVLPMGGYRVQGRTDAAAEALVADARALVQAGVFAIVLEGVPGPLASRITAEIDVPTIGIGAGVGCDGQVLVFHDLLGMSTGEPPKFVRRYASILDEQVKAIRAWADDVRGRRFPGAPETYE